MERMFLKIYDFLNARRPLMWALLIGSVLLFALLGSGIKLKEDVADFLPADKENQDVSWAFSHLGDAGKVVVTISPAGEDADSDLLMDAVDTLESRILKDVPQEYIGNLIAHTDASVVSEVMDFIVTNLPYYLDGSDYAQLDSLLQAGSLDNELSAARAVVLSPLGGMMRSVVTKDPLLLCTDRLQALEGFNSGSSFSAVDDYIFAEDGSALVTLDLAFGESDTGRAGKFIKALDKAVSETSAAFGGAVNVDPLGSVYIAHTNSSQIKKDTILSVLIAVLLIAVLLVSFFRSGKSIGLVGLTIAYGFLTALGLVALIRGSMSMIVLGMGAVIIGIAANYPLHFLTHISQGYSPRESLSDIVVPLTTGNITTVGAFLSLLFIASPAMRDLGLFAALLLVGTILFTLIFLPHLVEEQSEARPPLKVWNSFSKLNLGENRWVFIAVIAVTIFLSFFSGKVKFDTNLHNINYMTERQQANMDRMLALAQGSGSVSYVAVPGAGIDEAIENYLGAADRIDGLENVLPEGSAVHSLHDFVPSRELQQERLDMWNAFVSENGDRLMELVTEAAGRAGFKDDAFKPFESLLRGQYDVQDFSYFSTIADNLAAGYFIFDKDRCAVVSRVGTAENMTAQIEESLSDVPGAIVFDSTTMTGRMVSSLSEEFDTVLYFCAFIVFLLLVISFGRIELAGIAFLPLTLGWIWILGLMALLGINFNIINIILATFIFGMGDDYTIFITEGVMYEHAYGKKMLHTYERTIILSALIMFVGIGALIVAKHPAMLSLAYVVMIGMFCVVLMADILPPFLYRWLTRKKGKKRKEPLTLVNFTATVAAFIVFLIGALIVTVSGFFLITLSFGSKKGQYLYHCFLCKVSRFVFNNVFFTTHNVDCKESFDKPAIIVSNHQSHLDLMALLMLTPKMVVVTNKWVWNNPFYGILIRYADFCPVDNVLTDDLTKIESKIKDGYSVLVFPEGTRTMDGTIGRFHRGAFYLAEKYALDIIPVVLHGLNDVLPKEDLLLRKGRMSVKVLPRISPDDKSFGEDYRERARLVRRYMVDEFNAIASQTETVHYFSNRVMHNYIYKGADIARTVRKSLRKHSDWEELAQSLPSSGRVLFMEPGLGDASLICALACKGVEIDAVIADEMTRLLASNCVGVPANLHYLEAVEPETQYDCRVVFENDGYTLQ